MLFTLPFVIIGILAVIITYIGSDTKDRPSATIGVGVVALLLSFIIHMIAYSITIGTVYDAIITVENNQMYIDQYTEVLSQLNQDISTLSTNQANMTANADSPIASLVAAKTKMAYNLLDVKLKKVKAIETIRWCKESVFSPALYFVSDKVKFISELKD